MESKSLVICDPEEQYAQALAFYIMNCKNVHFQVHVCNVMEHIKDPDVLLISDVFPKEEREKINADKIIILSGGVSDFERKDVIYKYQTGQKILGSILEHCEEIYTNNEIFFTSPNRKKGEIIGVFSPIHRIGKTSYALELGEQLAESANVLYMNLELYGGIGGHFERGEQTVEDVLYYARQEKGNLGFILTKVVKRKGNLDYLLPALVSENIKEIPVEEWIDLLVKILNQSMYDTIILDVDEGVRDLYKLLKVCSKIYLLADHTLYSQAKLEQFEREVVLLGYEEILKKIERKDEKRD